MNVANSIVWRVTGVQKREVAFYNDWPDEMTALSVARQYKRQGDIDVKVERIDLAALNPAEFWRVAWTQKDGFPQHQFFFDKDIAEGFIDSLESTSEKDIKLSLYKLA